MRKVVRTDVLIVGGGGAGMRAAIAAADCGAEVILASKLRLGTAGATAYPIAEMAGYNAGDVRIPGDTREHFRDIMAAAQGTADPALAAITAANAPDTIRQLEEWGVSFDHEGDDYYIFKSCFSNSPRTHVIKGHGEPIIAAMKKQIEMRNDRITVMDDLNVLYLLKTDGRAGGAVACQKGELLEIQAGAVVLATGGSGQAFKRNMNPADVTGDGYAMAYDIGAELVNMEFMQIGMGFSWPEENIFNGYIWEGMPRLTDREGNDIFEGVLPDGLTEQDVMHEHRKHFPFSSSDCSQYLEIAVQRAINQGKGTEHGGVLIDLTHMTDECVSSLEDDCGIHHMWPIAREYMREKDVDLLKEKVEVALFAHAVNGGIHIDENAMSSVERPFAARECAGGPHGADRLGGNMMITCQVYGRIAGTKAAEYAFIHAGKAGKNRGEEEMEKLLYKKADLAEIRKRVRAAAQKHLMVDREEEGLLELSALTAELKKEIETAPEGGLNADNITVYHMLTTVGIMADSARLRKESRGSHQRRDYPVKDEAYSHPITVKKMM